MVADSITVEESAPELPARWEAGVIRVDAAIADGEPITLLLDTGASAFVIAPDAVRRARLPVRDAADGDGGVPVSDAHGASVRVGRIAHIDRLRCGPLDVRDVDALVRDLSEFESVAGVQIDGVLPATAFLGQLLVIDGPSGRVAVEPARAATLVGPNALDLADAGVPIARIEIAGRQVPLLLDTGSHERLAVPAALREELHLAAPPVETGRALGLSGAAPRRHARLAEDLVVAGHVLRRPVVVLTPADRAAAGLGLLREFRTTVDLAGRRVLLERATSDPVEFASIRGIGTGFLRGPRSWEVAYVTEGGGADRAGIRVGDVVSHIDGTPVGDVRATRLETLLAGKAAVTLRLEGGVAPREVTVPVEVVVD